MPNANGNGGPPAAPARRYGHKNGTCPPGVASDGSPIGRKKPNPNFERRRLTADERAFVIHEIAAFTRLPEIQTALADRFGLDIRTMTLRRLACTDPGRSEVQEIRAGLDARVGEIPCANRYWRIAQVQRRLDDLGDSSTKLFLKCLTFVQRELGIGQRVSVDVNATVTERREYVVTLADGTPLPTPAPPGPAAVAALPARNDPEHGAR